MSRGFKMVLFTEPSETFVGNKCTLPSALLVFLNIISDGNENPNIIIFKKCGNI